MGISGTTEGNRQNLGLKGLFIGCLLVSELSKRSFQKNWLRREQRGKTLGNNRNLGQTKSGTNKGHRKPRAITETLDKQTQEQTRDIENIGQQQKPWTNNQVRNKQGTSKTLFGQTNDQTKGIKNLGQTEDQANNILSNPKRRCRCLCMWKFTFWNVGGDIRLCPRLMKKPVLSGV